MLRRIATALQVLLFVVGALLVASVGVGWSRAPFVGFGSSDDLFICIHRGSIQCILIEPSGFTPTRRGWEFGFISASEVRFLGVKDHIALWPGAHRFDFNSIAAPHVARAVSAPLWLLAFLCLAWPVTSLLLARRTRKGRGFAVEAGGGGLASGIDPPPRRPDNIPPP